MKNVLVSLSISIFTLYGIDIGCKALEKQKECSEPNLLKDDSYFLDDLIEQNSKRERRLTKQKVKITEKLKSVTITFQKKRFLIERIDNKTCPPYCISPMKIKNIKTVGELETIDFIKSLKTNRDRILLDVRTTIEYKKSTIPTAINVPHVMLSPKSKYREEILKLLGVRKLQKEWYFKSVHRLLIFDNGILDSRASKTIETLLKIGYPQNKILYYRGGLRSWRSLGLTVL